MVVPAFHFPRTAALPFYTTAHLVSTPRLDVPTTQSLAFQRLSQQTEA